MLMKFGTQIVFEVENPKITLKIHQNEALFCFQIEYNVFRQGAHIYPVPKWLLLDQKYFLAS